MHKKEIEKLQAEKENIERQLAQSSTKSSALKIVLPTTKKAIAASGRTGSSPVVRRLRASHRRQRA